MSANPESNPQPCSTPPLDIMEEYGESSLNVSARFEYYKHAIPRIEPIDLLQEKLGLAGNESILDAGCSSGSMLLDLREKGHTGQLVGLDISAKLFEDTLLLEGMKTPRAADFLVGSVECIPLADSSVDISAAMFLLYHCDPLQGLEELKRITKPGGFIVVSTSSSKNKIEHRRFEWLIAERLGCTPPPRFNASFDTNTANYLLPQIFQPSDIEHIEHRARVDLTNRPGNPYTEANREAFERSLLTMKGSMEPSKRYGEWKQAIDSIWADIDEAMDGAEYFDQIERDYYFCKNTK